MQFGVVFALKPSFPVLAMVFKVLDLTDGNELLEAARLLCCIKVIVKRSLNISKSAHAILNLSLSLVNYHLKQLNHFFQSTDNVQSSIFHYMKVMAHLHQSNCCRNFVVFPICVREFKDNATRSELVYPMMVGFKIGLPDSVEQRHSFLEQLKIAVSHFHAAGVVHLDLYLSNVMWRETSTTEVTIKAIDWDAAHFTHESLSVMTHVSQS
jgi:serine/threonine protein kinase